MIADPGREWIVNVERRKKKDLDRPSAVCFSHSVPGLSSPNASAGERSRTESFTRASAHWNDFGNYPGRNSLFATTIELPWSGFGECLLAVNQVSMRRLNGAPKGAA